jgi:AbrB family transcriptional regulator, transcriptional pleiotropic regulator of transition state genes
LNSANLSGTLSRMTRRNPMDRTFTRRVDSLGRVVIPKPIRDGWELEVGHVLCFHVWGERLVLARQKRECATCGSETQSEFRDRPFCDKCRSELLTASAV